MRGSIPLAALLLTSALALRASEGDTRTLPFCLYADGDIVVPVTIDGVGPFAFLMDTGSSRTTVSDEIARRLDLGVVAHTVMVTPSGMASRPLVPLVRVRMGVAPPATVLAMVVPREGLAGGRAIDGIIGQDILALRIYTIDYERRSLTWHGASPHELPGTRLPLELRDGMLLISLPQTSSAPALRLIPDSGADGFVLFARDGQTLPQMTTLDTVGLRTLSGERPARRVMLEALAVGEIQLRNQMALVVDDGETDAALADGLLPLHLFARVTFNGPQRLLIVEAR